MLDSADTEAATNEHDERPTSTRVEGLVDLVADAVVNGAKLVERAHRGVAGRPFWLLRQIPTPYIEKPVRVAEAVHDAHLTVVYGSIRGVARAAQVIASAALRPGETTAPASPTNTADGAWISR